jgi:hypothetical protein
MKKNLESLTFEMDGAIGTVTRLVESLDDLRTELGILRQDMDIAKHRGEERLYYEEHHRKIRQLDDLMLTVSEKAHDLHLSIFEAVRGSTEHEHTRDRAPSDATEGAA